MSGHDWSLYPDMIQPDIITYLEMARLALDLIPESLAEQMDISDDEMANLTSKLNQFMNNE